MFGTALAVLEQGGGVKNSVVAARHEFMSHVSAVVECDFAPSVRGILGVDGVRLQRRHEAVQPIVVARGSGGNVPRGCGVVKAGRINDIVVQWLVALVVVGVGLDDEINVVLNKQRLENILALGTDGGADVLGTHIPRAMHS